MSILTLNQFGVLSPNPLFQNINLTLGRSDRLGIVAQNGGGKSTLLRCIAGKQEPSSGSLTTARGTHIGFVKQEVPQEWLDLSLFEVIRSNLPVEEQENNAWRVELLLEEFNTPQEYVHKSLRTLSGGWQRLALIAREWIADPDLLLLDEPTNHLDLDKINILERWIQDKSGQAAMIIVSHDRSFLDICTKQTLFLRPEESRFYASPFSKSRELLSHDDAAEATKLEQGMKEANRLRRSANELKNIGINSRSDAAQRKSKLMAQRASNLEQTFKKPHKESSAQIKLTSRDTHARVLLSLKNTVIRTPVKTALFKVEHLTVFQGDRIVILGENGVGKSVFIKHILKVCSNPEDNPQAKISPTIVLGYADQHMSQLPDKGSPFDYIMDVFSLGDQSTRTLLAGAGFPVDQQKKSICDFSSGQKARLNMLSLRLQTPNFYLLDEPTNHVDITGQEKLEEEILLQNATCILASHDRSFVQNIGTRFLEIKDKVLVEME